MSETRAAKLVEISTNALRALQRSRLTPEESRSLAELRPARNRNGISLPSAAASLEYAKKNVFERVSVSRDHEILTGALRHRRGQISLDELKALLEPSGGIGAGPASRQRDRHDGEPRA